MALARLDSLVESLCGAGFPPELPAACVMRATHLDERVLRAPLRQLPGAVREAGLSPPAVVVLGRVAAPGLVEASRSTHHEGHERRTSSGA